MQRHLNDIDRRQREEAERTFPLSSAESEHGEG
jgi:hypothetical protein